jgi:hypothetical protein
MSRSRTTVTRKIRIGEPSDLDRDVLAMTPADRVRLAWELSLEAAALDKRHAALQPRLQRSVVELHRR